MVLDAIDRERLNAGCNPLQTCFDFYAKPDPSAGAPEPGKKQPSDRHPAPAADSAGLTGPPPAGPVISAITSAR